MLNDTIVAVGIPTQGTPRISSSKDGVVLHNMLIGKGFHWQRPIKVILPGRIELTGDPEYPVVNYVPVEKYLECVVGSEMNPDAPAEFLKAHAIISRSWVMGKINGSHPADDTGKTFAPDLLINWEDTCDHHGFDVCSDDHCQRYQGLQPIPPTILNAIESTAHLILLAADGTPIDARFSKCCGGRTEIFSSCWQDRIEPSLDSIEDPWCDLSSLPQSRRHTILKSILKDYDLINEGGYRWETQISSERIRRNLNEKFGRDIGHIRGMEIIRRGASGRAVLLKLFGETNELTIGKELMVRRLLAPTHLYSSLIEITSDSSLPEIFQISGRGWGHGVGLCQIGAARMALEGFDYRRILSFYYPGSIIGHL